VLKMAIDQNAERGDTLSSSSSPRDQFSAHTHH
jgi:hypothetical protein